MNESVPAISFIIPAFNFEKYIEQCILSIENQTYQNIEIIVINDGSTDGTQEIINRLASRDSRIRAINKLNEGVSIARNYGIENAKGDFIAFVDADDYITSDYAEYMLNLASESGAEFCVSTDCYTYSGEPQTKKEVVKVLSREDATTLLLSPKIIVGSWNKLYKRSLLIENDIRFSSSLFYGEGLKFITDVAQKANRTVVGKRKVYFYRRDNYQSATSKFNIEKFYNGAAALDAIENDLTIRMDKVIKMLNWHKCQFRMGTVVRIEASHQRENYGQYYKECLSYVRRNTLGCLFIKGVSMYKKMLLIGCSVCPSLMAKLDYIRRKRIAERSV